LIAGLALWDTVVWLRLRFWRKARARAEHDLATKINEVVAEFPQEVQTWGEPSVLREQDIVQELIRELEAPRSEATC
jgi:hypothetical protein